MNAGPEANRAPVTQEAVVDAALALLAEGGLDAVSFRRIAKEVGVSGPTLYWHVDNKRQLMDLMAEELFRRAGVPRTEPGPDEPWWEWLREDARRMFSALVATRDAPQVLAGNRPGRDSLARIDRSLAVLVDAGLSPGQAQHALFAIGAYVIGSATEWQAEAERSRSTPAPAADDVAADERRAEVLAGRPVLLAAITEVLGEPHETTFEFGLDLLVQGLRARFAPQA
ncbi:TetR/AcrR family transcriptional regulator C-terminal domain-containing protein [Geodermatophilus sabuli]|uniref:TetR/AcrR family transcriptional regulator C-terminal domain-containing protein n=1 Tax=Geodermatophilus sabuli TaxID=1564158 RepID=UPI0019546A4B